MARIMLVDASPILYSAYATVGHLSSSKGEPTGVAYGFLRQLNSWVKAVKPDKVCICWDLMTPIKKAEGLDHYKSNREFTDDKAKMYAQVPALRELLKGTRYTQADAEGYEADDIIGALARKFGNQGHVVKIVSTDNDMCQVISSHVTVYMPAKSKPTKTPAWEKNSAWVLDEFGVPPEHLLAYRSLAGDVSDNLPPVLMGKDNWSILAAQLCKLPHPPMVENVPSLPYYYHALFTEGPFHITPTMDDLWRENFLVMSLPDPPTINIVKGLANEDVLKPHLERMEMSSMLKQDVLDLLVGRQGPIEAI